MEDIKAHQGILPHDITAQQGVADFRPQDRGIARYIRAYSYGPKGQLVPGEKVPSKAKE